MVKRIYSGEDTKTECLLSLHILIYIDREILGDVDRSRYFHRWLPRVTTDLTNAHLMGSMTAKESVVTTGDDPANFLFGLF